MLSGIVFLSGTAYIVTSSIPTTRELWHFWELTQPFARLKPFALLFFTPFGSRTGLQSSSLNGIAFFCPPDRADKKKTPLRKPSSLICRKFVLEVITVAQGYSGCLSTVDKGKLHADKSSWKNVSCFYVVMLLSTTVTVQTVVGGYVCVSKVILRLQSQRRSFYFVEWYCLHPSSDPFCRPVCSDRPIVLHSGETGGRRLIHGAQLGGKSRYKWNWSLEILPSAHSTDFTLAAKFKQKYPPTAFCFKCIPFPQTVSSFLFSLTVETSGAVTLKNTSLSNETGDWFTYCNTMFIHTDAFKAQQIKKKSCHIHKHTYKHQRAFVIQQQPAVIDWSICLCVAYKWATWYSALFIWNQLRQRCCVSACSTRALFLPRSLFLCLCERESDQERTRWRGKGREILGGEGRVCAVLCFTACICWPLVRHVHVYNESSCLRIVLSGILIECRVPVRLQHCWFQSTTFHNPSSLSFFSLLLSPHPLTNESINQSLVTVGLLSCM